MKKKVILTAALSCALGSAAYAEDFSVVAGACKVDPSAVPYVFQNFGGSITFAGSATGTISLWCPIDHPIDAPGFIELLATDNAVRSEGFVQALYYGMNGASGNPTLIGGLISTTNQLITQNTVIDPHGLNTYYYVRVNLYRSRAGQSVVFHGLSVY